MTQRHTCFVTVAHQDDWQLFMGSDVYAHIRDPHCRPIIIITTAGNGKHGEYHWKSRLSGAVLSICRALPAWSPYALPHGEAPALPSGFSVTYDCARFAGKTVLRCDIGNAQATGATLYLLHIPEPLAALHGGEPAVPLWPQGAAPYASWSDFVETLQAILLEEAAGSTQAMRVHAADPDDAANPDDHADHALTSNAIREIAARHPQFRPVWYGMYANRHRPVNLDEREADEQRAAIYAYGGGYTATAAGFGETWRTGWEREYPVFKGRRYAREDAEPRGPAED